MQAQKLVAIVLIVAGALALAYGGFDYTRDTHKIDLGPLKLEVEERKHFNVPIWAGLASVAIGIVLLGVSGRKGS